VTIYAYVFVYHGPRPTHGSAAVYGTYAFAKGRRASTALNLAAIKLPTKVAIHERVNAIWRAQGSPLPWCVYHKLAASICAPLHEAAD